MNCPHCGVEMEVTNSVHNGVGEMPFEWECESCGVVAALDHSGDTQFYTHPETDIAAASPDTGTGRTSESEAR